MARTYARKPLEDRFWPKVLKSGGCWIWQAHQDKDGYGALWTYKDDGRTGTFIRAHRLSWIIHNGPIPDDLFVLHKCDNPSCVNPEHLFIGDAVANALDAKSKGRLASGDRNWARQHPELLKRGESHWSSRKPGLIRRGEQVSHSKLTSEDVMCIRTELHNAPRGTAHKLAVRYGVTDALISRIAKRLCWTHLT